MPKQESFAQDVSDIVVLFITYNRSDLLEISFRAIKERMDFGTLRVEFVVSDDASAPAHLARIRSLSFDKHLLSETNKGLGANTNRGIVATKGRYILQIQDDFEFVGAENLIFTALKIMHLDPDVGIVQLTNETPGVSHEMRCLADGTRYLVFENDGIARLRNSDARPYSDRPHLKRRQFCEDIGPYKERVPMTIMELNYQQRVATQERWRVAVLAQASAFNNIGVERSFNPGYVRAKRLQRIEHYPLVGPIFRRARPKMRWVRDWIRGLIL